MAITPLKRQKMEKLIYDTFNALDPTGKNTKYYKEYFSTMSDTKFDVFFKEFFKDEEKFIPLQIVDYEVDLRMDQVEAAAKVLGVPLFEHIYCPHYTMDKNNVVVSKEKVPTGYAHVKKEQQMLYKKNGMSTSTDVRSSTTGQVSGADKNGRESDLENSMVTSLGMTNTLRELNGPRADDPYMKQQMYTAIYNKGYVTLDELESDPANKTTLNTVNAYLLGMGLNSDLVTRGLLTRATIERDA